MGKVIGNLVDLNIREVGVRGWEGVVGVVVFWEFCSV